MKTVHSPEVTQRINNLIELLRNPPDAMEFNMETFGRTTMCGTAACVAGLAVWQNDPEWFECWIDGEGERFLPVTAYAATLLGMDPYGSDKYDMFTPNMTKAYSDVRPSQAVRMLRNYRNTGKIEWPDN